MRVGACIWAVGRASVESGGDIDVKTLSSSTTISLETKNFRVEGR